MNKEEITKEVIKGILPQEGDIVAIGNKVLLGVIKKTEREEYLSVSYEHSPAKSFYKEEEFCDEIWGDFLSEKAFVCSVYEKISGTYIGYCSIKDMTKEDWELAIELKADECHKGYGTEVLKLLMEAVHQLSGQRFFRARVDFDNHASQHLMKKLGAFPNGVSELWLHGEEINAFQKEYKYLITDEMREVAEEFGMDAEDILGYVLEYRFDMDKIKG